MAAATSAGAAGEGFLSLRGLTKRYGGFTAVDDLSLDIGKGELVAFLGPSGCGKTTSLRMIAGLIEASEGRIAVGGRDLTHIPTYERDMGMVFQSYALFPHMSVAGNLAFGLQMRKLARAEIERRVREALALVHLEAGDAMRRLTAVHGIGPWTAEVYLLFSAGHPDIFPAKDVAWQTAVGHALGIDPRPGDRALAALAESWSPWRGVASRLFWAYYRELRGRDAVPTMETLEKA